MPVPINRHRIWQVGADAALIALAWWLAFQLRFDFSVPNFWQSMLWETMLIVVAIKLSVFVAFGFYQRMWRYVSTRDMWRAVLGVTVASALAAVAIYFGYPVERLRLPRGVALADLLLLSAFVAGSRLAARTLLERPARGELLAHGREALVVGAGDAGQLVLKELQKSRGLGVTPIGLVDDDPRKRNMRLHGVRVLGTTEELPSSCARTGPTRSSSPFRRLRASCAGASSRRRAPRTCRSRPCPASTSSSRATSTSPGSSVPSRWRTCSAASRSRSTSSRSRPTSATAPCSSRARAGRSARSSAARSRGSARRG